MRDERQWQKRFKGNNDQAAWTYKAALDYSFTPVVLGYASYNRGFKSGQYNITSATAAIASPTLAEFVDAYEIGLKSRLFGNKVLLNIEGFLYNVTNLQVRSSVSINNVPTQISGNAGSARNKGVDMTLEVAPTPNLNLTANVTYADYRYTSYQGAIFVNYVNGYAGSNYIADATGNRVIFAEPWSGNVGARFRINTSLGRIVAIANLAFHTKTFYDAQMYNERGDYQLLNASIDWTSLGRSWGFSIWGRNLTNVKYSLNSSANTVSGTYSPGAPRTFGVTLRSHL